MRELIAIRQHRMMYQLTWILNNICTNHCDYCVPELHRGSNHHYDWQQALHFADHIIASVGEMPIKLSIGGGEPTVSPHLPELARKFASRGHYVSITSNSSRSPEWWDEHARLFTAISFSYHHEWANPDYFRVAVAAARHTRVLCRIMMDSRHFDQCVAIYYETLKYYDLSVEAVRILPETSGSTVGAEYTAEQEAWLLANSRARRVNREDLPAQIAIGSSYWWSDGTREAWGDPNGVVSRGENNFLGWACNIGVESLFINWDGWVKSGNCLNDSQLFHIDEFHKHPLPRAGQICTLNSCNCMTDVNITKFRINHTPKQQPITFYSKSDK
jgi:organic radical activating enzyme